ncbi:MAG: acetylxylan esterase, partial [Clostridiales bacterium]|nr:acetylxylan esterase [Candidatus Equinaster intestinalis]
LYNELAHSALKYNGGKDAKFTINSNDIHESPDAPGGTAGDPTIVDPNPIPPVTPGQDPDEPEPPTPTGADYNPMNASNYVAPSSSASAVPAIFGKVGSVAQVGTGHDLDNDSSTNSFSYAVGDEINFCVRAKSGTSITYSLYKDNPDKNAVTSMGETAVSSASSAVKSGSATTDLLVTTKMNQAGTVRLHVILSGVTNGTFDITAAAGMSNIKQAIEYANKKPTDVFSTLKSTFDSRVTTIAKVITDNSADIKSFLTSASVGTSKTFGGKLKLSCVTASVSGYKYFDFAIAVNDTVGVTTTNASTGLFSDSVYSTAASSTGEKAFNLRPATGYFAVPTSSSGINKVVANYKQYGLDPTSRTNVSGEAVVAASNTFTINMNSHGYDNSQAYTQSYKDTLNNTSKTNGGIGSFLRASDDNVSTYKESYAYGVAFRDYLALQTGKKLANLLSTNSKSITTFGKSFGAWQSVMMGALDKSINTTQAYYPWLCSVSDSTANYIASEFNATDCAGIRYFSTVSAGQYIASTMSGRPSNYTIDIQGGFSDRTAPASGVISLYNAFKNANCNKSITLHQFEGHGNSGYQSMTDAYEYPSTASGSYNPSNPHNYTEEGGGGGQDEPETPPSGGSDASYDPRTTKTTKTYYTDATCKTTTSLPYTSTVTGTGSNFPSFAESSTSLNALFEQSGGKPIVGCDHDLTNHNDATNNAITYGVNKDIKFTVDVVGDYVIYYELFKDNPIVNAIPSLGEAIAFNNKGPAVNDTDKTLYVDTNAPVKSGRARGKLELTTQMKEAGTVRLTCWIEKDNGKKLYYTLSGTREEAMFNIVAAADYTNIKSCLVQSGKKPADQDTFFDTMRTTANAQVTKLASSLDSKSSAITSYLSSASVGSTYEISGVIKLKCYKSTDGYKCFYYTIATDSAGGMTYLYSDCTKRPATGTFKIPTNPTGVAAYYSPYGGGPSAADIANSNLPSNVQNGNSSPLWVTTWPNGENPEGTNTGLKGIADASQQTITDPLKTYAYGMIFRDYISLQIGKRLYNYVKGNNATAKVSHVGVTGTSQGGFQSWLVNALDYDVDSNATDVTWMACAGQETSNNILSGFSPYGSGSYYFNPVSAAEYIAKTKSSRPSAFAFKLTGSMGDTTSPISGIIAIWNAMSSWSCKKQMALPQYKFHVKHPMGNTWVNVNIQKSAS